VKQQPDTFFKDAPKPLVADFGIFGKPLYPKTPEGKIVFLASLQDRACRIFFAYYSYLYRTFFKQGG
jgi:hypothetical protein